MAIIFTVEGANVKRVNKKFVCKTCGASPGKPSHHPDCDICDGYGIDPTDNPLGEYAFLVSENDAIVILHDLLNYGCQEKPYWKGELSPDDVLIQLALADYRIDTIVNPKFSFGYEDASVDTGKAKTDPPSEATLRKYAEKLQAFAEKAIDVGENIIYFTR